MRKREVAPDVMLEALALRQVGYTTLAISQRLGVSVRTLQRHFTSMKAKKGSLKQDLLENVKADLLDRVANDQTIKEEAARLITDDLAHSRHLREIMLAASGKMQAASLQEAVQVMRAAAAYSTVLKNTSDVIRHGLRLERFEDNDQSQLPELIITELTAEEIVTLRGDQPADEESPVGDDATEADVVVEFVD